MTQPLPCPRLEAEFARMFAATPKPVAPVPMDQEAGTTPPTKPDPLPTREATPVPEWPKKDGGHKL